MKDILEDPDLNHTVNGMPILGLYVVGYAMVNSTNYLLDQGAAYLYQLHDAYGVPSTSQIQGFKSGNHTGNDAITFNLHGYPCVYTYRTRPISSNYLGGVSMFVRGSSNTTYYSSVAYNNYLHARKYLLEDGQGIYPKLDYKHYEENHGSNITDTLKKHVCYQAALDQMSNVTMGAAVDPAWYAVKTSGHQYDANPDDISNTAWTPVSTLSHAPSEADRRVHLTEVKIRAWVVIGDGYYKINVSFGGGPEKNLVPQQTVSYLIPKNYSHKFDIWGEVNQNVTVKFYTKVSTAGLVHSENYNMSYEDVRWWNWTTWYPEKVKPSFDGSKLLINNYKGSLYMGTVQAYIQGLEQGAINKNCTFIPITAYPISVVGPNPDGSFNHTRIITYEALDGTTSTIKTTYQILSSLGLMKLFMRVEKPGVKIEYIIGLTSSGIELILWYGDHIAMIPIFGRLSVAVNVLLIGYDIATGDWQMAILDIAILLIDVAGVHFGTWNSACLFFGISSMWAIYGMAFSAALVAGILAGIFFYNLALLCGATVGQAMLIGVIGGVVVGVIVFILILIFFVL